MSSINPNNIDGTYPIAGQDNDSQGFRDNFTNIKNNFTFAYDEITDLQSKVVLKSALNGGALNNDMAYSQLISPQLIQAVETDNDLGTKTGTFAISWEDGHFQYFTTSGNVTLSFTDWPTSGLFTKLRLQITTDTTNRTVTFPSAVKTTLGLSDIQGASGQTVTLPTAGVYIFELTTYDSGSNITIEDVLRNYDITTTGASGSFNTVNAGAVNAVIIGNTGAAIQGATLSTTGNVIGGLAQFAAINSTPVGNASASTGAFTTLTASSINSAGNVLATGGVFNALTVNGEVTLTGNVNRAGGQIDSGYQYYAISGNTAITANVNVSRVIVNPTGDAFGVVFTLPAGNVDAKVVTFSSTANIAELQPVGSIGTTVVPSVNVAIPKGTSIQFFYHNSEGKWYKIS